MPRDACALPRRRRRGRGPLHLERDRARRDRGVRAAVL